MTVAHITAPLRPQDETLLTPAALDFLGALGRRFGMRVEALLARRREVQARYDAGERPTFLSETAEVRASEWTVAPIPPDLLDRRVEITGPVDRKMIINGMNSGAQVFMADFEDATTPTWHNLLDGQLNLHDAVRRTIRYDTAGKSYTLHDKTAVLMVRPRGWHLPERHVVVDDHPLPGALFDFGLYFFHNAAELLARGTGPYFYLPKLQSHTEAALWNEVFTFAQDALHVPFGSVRATVLIETLPAAFEMDEILFALRAHSAGLNCGRWDYIFSFIKTLRADPHAVLPDRQQVTMIQPFMRAYTQRVIQVCHRRGVHAMGGMAAQIPIKADPEANEAAMEKVRADKLREVQDGHDGTWVAHPALVPVAQAIFDAHMPGPNQISRRRDDVTVTPGDLLQVPSGARTEAGLRHNIRVGVQYIEAWLRGVGCVPLYDLMEDAATAEISRTQVWQWLHYGPALDDGRTVTPQLVQALIDDEIGRFRETGGRFADAERLFTRLVTEATLTDFLTLPAYEMMGELP